MFSSPCGGGKGNDFEIWAQKKIQWTNEAVNQWIKPLILWPMTLSYSYMGVSWYIQERKYIPQLSKVAFLWGIPSSTQHVPGRNITKIDIIGTSLLIGIVGGLERSELKWLNWRTWMTDWIELNWIELNDWVNERVKQWMNELKWNDMIWNGMKWNEWMNQWMKFADLIFQKRSETLSSLVILCEIELSLQSCALFVDHFCRSRPAPAETETLLWRPRKPLYPQKTEGFAPEGFSSRSSRVPNLMMWLTWWWECWPWESSVTRKFSN